MLRTDGSYAFYQIKARYLNRDKKDWFLHTDYYQPKINEKKVISDCFTANGECWQLLGEHGVFDLENAKKGLKVSQENMKNNPDNKGYEVELAIFKVLVYQKQEMIL